MLFLKGGSMSSKTNVILTIEELENTLSALAVIIKLHGDAYLPIFRRIYEELQTARQNQDIRDIALKLVSTQG